MEAKLIAAVINGAFQLIASLRRFGMTNDEINMRFERADNGEEPITVDEVQNKLNRFQSAIDVGRELGEEDRVQLPPTPVEGEEE